MKSRGKCWDRFADGPRKPKRELCRKLRSKAIVRVFALDELWPSAKSASSCAHAHAISCLFIYLVAVAHVPPLLLASRLKRPAECAAGCPALMPCASQVTPQRNPEPGCRHLVRKAAPGFYTRQLPPMPSSPWLLISRTRAGRDESFTNA